MTSLVRLRRALLALAIPCLLRATPAHATWGAGGLRLTGSSSQPASVAIVPGEPGRAFVTWIDSRSGYNSDVYATSIRSDATADSGWVRSGVPVTAVTCFKYGLVASPDATGGAYLAWSDDRCGGSHPVRIGRIRAHQVAPATQVDSGLRLSDLDRDGDQCAIALDGGDGAYVAWREVRWGDTDVRLQRAVSESALAPGWPSAGLLVASGPDLQETPALAADGAGGVFIAWIARAGAVTTLRLQRITSLGSVAPGWSASGVALVTSTAVLGGLQMVSDGSGGALLSWREVSPTGTRLLAQRVSASSALAASWPLGGAVVCAAGGDRSEARMVADGAGGAYLAWSDARGADADLYALHLAADGHAVSGWPANGLAVCALAGTQLTPDLGLDEDLGVFLAWSDGRGGEADLYATRLTADGTTVSGWPTGGALVCGQPGEQSAPRIAVAGSEADVVWLDGRDRLTENVVAGGPSLFLSHLFADGPPSTQATAAAATHHDGQTFLTWQAKPDTGWTYRVYRSAGPIVDEADLSLADLLGAVGDSTVFDLRLASLGYGLRTFATDSMAVPLETSQGLFVVTTPATRASWYAVTAQLRGHPEDRGVTVGGNALAEAVAEVLAPPRPVYQGRIGQIPGAPDLYTLWTSDRDTPLFPAMSNRPSLPFDCGVLHGAPEGIGLVRPHPRGNPFTAVLAHSMWQNEWVLGLDDYTRNEDLQTWWYGYHEDYDLFGPNPATGPVNGRVVDYTDRRALYTVRWWLANFPFDPMRHYAFGYSMGGTLSMRWALTQSPLFAAVMASTPKLDFSLDHDPDPLADFNTGAIHRVSLDRMWGARALSLPTSAGGSVYTANNDDSLAIRAAGSGQAFVIHFSGRHDRVVGWAERPPFFDAMQRARLGGVHFWDNRDHTGFVIPGAFTPMLDFDYLVRFRRDRSWPAFSRCSTDGHAGDGTIDSADSLGTINGPVDWQPEVVDLATTWEAVLSTRSLRTRWSVLPAPESLAVDVTPRRTQRFHPAPGGVVEWTVTRVGDGALLQSGVVTADTAGLVTIPQVKVRRGGSRLQLLDLVALGAPPRALPGAAMLAPFPNPASSGVALAGVWPGRGPARIELIDVSGRRERTLFAGPVEPGPWRLEGALHTVPPGLHLLLVRQGDATQTRKLLLLR